MSAQQEQESIGLVEAAQVEESRRLRLAGRLMQWAGELIGGIRQHTPEELDTIETFLTEREI